MKLSGFLRLVPFTPSPVMPVFKRDQSDDLYVQTIGEGGVIESFKLIQAPRQDRIIVQDDANYPNIEVGQVALVAFDRGSADIALRRGHRYNDMIVDFIDKRKDSLSSFLVLELALLVGDRGLATQYAARCMVEMGGGNDRLALSWLEGSTIPADIKIQLAGNHFTKMADAFEPQDHLWAVGFGGPKFLVRGLTVFCTDALKTSRASMIREIFHPKDRAHLPTSDDFELVAHAIRKRVQSADAAEKFLMRTSYSWGRVALGEDIDPNWLSVDYQEYVSYVTNSRILFNIRIEGFDLGSNRGQMLFYLWSSLEKMTRKGAEAIEAISMDETHGLHEILRARDVTERLSGYARHDKVPPS